MGSAFDSDFDSVFDSDFDSVLAPLAAASAFVVVDAVCSDIRALLVSCAPGGRRLGFRGEGPECLQDTANC
ncbi:MAG: hypothetical protein AMXMBFR46_25030 [Acidimicrobiia bacterium]